ncbi:hypothetical protein C8039_13700 [Halogeometricum sp. wsp3]|nr:hypothetical protein C8039_13700 [Halogeometricum sp. wsp3]
MAAPGQRTKPDYPRPWPPVVFVGMSDANGFEEWASGSQGDPRVLIAMKSCSRTVNRPVSSPLSPSSVRRE